MQAIHSGCLASPWLQHGRADRTLVGLVDRLLCQSGVWRQQTPGVKAWVNFDGTSCTTAGSWCTVRSGHNVSGVQAVGAGSSTRYVAYFQTAMADANYVVSITADSWWKNSYGHSQVCGLSFATASPQTATSVEFDCSYQDDNNNAMYGYPIRTGMLTVHGN